MQNDDIVALVRRLIEAENAMDATTAGRLLAADFAAMTRARGAEQDRAALLHELAHPTARVERHLEGDPWVRQSGDLAVARTVVAIMEGSPPAVVSRFRNIHVLAREGNMWKCLAWQVTKLA